MKTALSGLMIALLATAVPALAQTSTRHSGGHQRQAVSTQTQAQAGTRYSGGRQAASAQARTGTRYSGSRQTASTQTQTGTRYSGSNDWQRQRQAQAPSGTGDSGANFRGRQRQGTQQGWRSGERSHVQGQTRDFQRERHDGDRRRFANNEQFRRGQGQHRGWENNRGNHYGWDNNRGRHYGWGNDRGRPTYGGGQWIDRQQHQQQQRIVQGLRSGELTRHEANRLFSEQRDLRRQERAFRSDGVLTPWERGEMREDLSSAGRHIYNQTHDAQRRF